MARIVFCLLALCVQASLQRSIADNDSEGVSETQTPGQDEYGELPVDDNVQTKGTRNARPEKRWPGGRVPYAMDGSVDSVARTNIAKAISMYHTQTCVKFVPRKSEADYVMIKRPTTGVCNSPVGRSGGQQIINLGKGCEGVGTIVHEMMHALGFHHEQNRPDRDQYVWIYFNNIRDDAKFAFNKQSSSSTLNLPYDYGSVMHYGAKAFTKNDQFTIVPKDGNTKKIGIRTGLSTLDVRKINAMYSCSVCADYNPSCAGWAANGECQKNSAYMLKNCRKSCYIVDTNATCPAWAQRGDCQTYPDYMLKNCKKSCNVSTC